MSVVITNIIILTSGKHFSGLETREYGRGDASRWPRGTPYQQKLALTSPTSGGRSVGIVRLRTQSTEFFFSVYLSEGSGGTRLERNLFRSK
jgi:hypothetical protein